MDEQVKELSERVARMAVAEGYDDPYKFTIALLDWYSRLCERAQEGELFVVGANKDGALTAVSMDEVEGEETDV